MADNFEFDFDDNADFDLEESEEESEGFELEGLEGFDLEGFAEEPTNASSDEDEGILAVAVNVLDGFTDRGFINSQELRDGLLDILLSGRLIIDVPVQDILVCSNAETDKKYRAFICDLMPGLKGIIDATDVGVADVERARLVELFVKAATIFLWDKFSRRQDNCNNTKLYEKILKSFKEEYDIDGIPYPFDIDSTPSELAKGKASPISCELDYYLFGAYALFLPECLDEEESEEPEPKEPEPVVDEPHEYDMVLEDTIQNLLSIYDKLYADCFVNAPLGVLTEGGIVTLKENGDSLVDVRTKLYSSKLFSTIKNYFGFTDECRGNIPDNAREFLSHSYYPLYHLYNINGMLSKGNKCASWVEFKRPLHGYLKTVLAKIFETSDMDYIALKTEIVRRLSDVVIVEEFNTRGMMSFIYHRTDAGDGNFFTNNVAAQMGQIIGLTTGSVIAEPNLGYDVFKFMYVGDLNAYNKEILFAYKAYENMIKSGAQISSKSIIVGRQLKDGMPYTANLASPQQVFTTILAGSGSGKGVLTLSLLAGLFAAGHAVAYVDYKPDMAAMLWNMERKINTPIYAVDSLANRDKFGAVPVRNYEYGLGGGIYDALPVVKDSLRVLPYLKSMQLACVMAGLRAKGIDIGNNKKLFFVLDEAQQCNDLYSSLLDALEAYKPPKVKKDESSPTEALDKAVEKMKYVFSDDLVQGIRKCGNTTGRTGEVGFIIIGQATDPSAWKSGKGGDWKYSLFGFPIGKTTLKLMGNGIGRSSIYAITADKLAGEKMLNNLGYWAVSKTASSGKDKSTVVVKSYMVLNENDYGVKSGGFADSLLKNLDENTQNSVIMNDLTYGDGKTLRDSVGFYGLMKLLCNNDEQRLQTAMGSMYTLATNIVTKAGILSKLGYANLEQYLYSADPESFFTINQIIEGYEKGGMGAKAFDKKSELVAKHKEELETFDAETENDKDNPDFNEEERLAEREALLARQAEELEALKESGDSTFSGIFNEASNGTEPEGASPNEPTGGGGNSSAQGHFNQAPESNNTFREPAFQPPQNNRSDADIFTEPVPEHFRASSEPVNSRNGFEASAYTEPLNIENNPFANMGGDISSTYAFKQMSDIILKDIKKAYGSLDRIHSVDISNSGLMVINNYKYMPQIPASIIETMPIDIRNEVAKGNVAELFYFDNLYKFHNLVRLSIESTQLAEGRVRFEMGCDKKGWGYLFRRFKNLSELYIAGNKFGSENDATSYEDNGRAGFALREKLSDSFGLSNISNSWVGKLWGNPRMRHVKRGLGAVLGVKGLMMAASLFGPWGVFFGAVTVGSMLLEHTDKNNRR